MSEKSVKIGDPKRSYFTSFTTNQDPLTEGGVWRPRITDDLTDFQVTGGKAIGKAQGVGAFDDSAALLSGFSQDVEIIATVFKGTGLAATTHEMELLLRSQQSDDLAEQIECLFAFNGNVQCVQWFDNGGVQGFTFLSANSGSESLGREFITGDRIKTRISGNTVTMSVIDSGDTETVLGVYTADFFEGQPGIGAFTRASEGGDLTKFNFQDVTVTDI